MTATSSEAINYPTPCQGSSQQLNGVRWWWKRYSRSRFIVETLKMTLKLVHKPVQGVVRRCIGFGFSSWEKVFPALFLVVGGETFPEAPAPRSFAHYFASSQLRALVIINHSNLCFPSRWWQWKKLQCIWALAWNEEEEEEKTCTLILHAVEENFWAMFLENKIKLFPRGKEEKTFFFAHPPTTWYYNVFILLLSIQQWPRAKLVSNNSNSPETDKHQCRRRDRFIFIQFLVIV